MALRSVVSKQPPGRVPGTLLTAGGPGFVVPVRAGPRHESSSGPDWSFAGISISVPAAAPRLQPKLTLGAVNDPLEREADRVAEQIMRMPSALPSLSGAPRNVSRKCATCAEEEETVRTKPAGPAGAARTEVPGLVHDVVSSPGRPLDVGERAFFEPRFGHDFSAVRIHTDATAAASARAVGALAYTVGRDIAFDAGRYAPGRATGRTLLAHELAHVVQQGGQARSSLRRFVPAEAEVEPEVEEEAVEGETSHGTGPRHAGLPPQNTLQGRLYARGKQLTEEQLQFELELPSATSERGGASDKTFLEEKPKATEAQQTEYGTHQITYKPTVFHMLDAIEYDVAQAKSNDDILDIYRSYFPDSAARLAPDRNPQRVHYRTMRDKIRTFQVAPEGADGDGMLRTPVFVNAVKRRTDIDPKLSTDAALEAIIEGLLRFEAQQEASATARAEKDAGPCQAHDVPRKGGDKDHDAYAKEVTGKDTDFELVTPGGPKCVTDGQDSTDPNVVWEVKTRHEWSTPQGIAGGIFNPNIQAAIMSMESQLARCQAVAQRCGYTYKWAFENKAAADLLAIMWKGRVIVVHRPRAGGSGPAGSP
jgi:hypothetical protein